MSRKPLCSPLIALVVIVMANNACFPVFAADDLPTPAIPGLRYYYPPGKVEHRVVECDVCVYGGTSGGVVAAIQAQRMGKKAVLLEFGKHVGGLTTGGLSHTDGGGPSVCGGIAREFYRQAGQANFRPSQAEALYLKMLKQADVQVYRLAHLDKVKKDGARIISITMEDGLEVRAKQFIDATYEGDLLARAGVSYHFGREANSKYGETYNGIRSLGAGGHNWPKQHPVDPFVTPGDPSSGLLPRVFKDTGTPGGGDKAIQGFCFRMLLTRHKDRLPFPKPAVYDLKQYELLARLFETGVNPRARFSNDTNNHHLFNGAYFIDFVGGNYGWPEGDWKQREQIFQDHANYQIGVMHFLVTSPRIPKALREYFKQFGLPHDEYKDTGGWTHQLYIREGRRMVSDYVMTQHNCQGREVPKDSIGLASYNMDSHHCQMGYVEVEVDGKKAYAVRNEGNVEIGVNPYPIAYRAITPKRAQCTNLLVPIALSSSHIAFGSIRMEPVFMILSQSAATAAVHAINDGVAVQDVDYDKLAKRLLADKQILTYTGPLKKRGGGAGRTIAIKSLQDQGVIVVDDAQADGAKLTGAWTKTDFTKPHVGASYVHDGNVNKGKCAVAFRTALPKAGAYEVRLAYTPHSNRATNVPVTLVTAAGEKTIIVNQKKQPPIGNAFVSLGKHVFGKDAKVVVSNAGTDGYVIVDAVLFVPAAE